MSFLTKINGSTGAIETAGTQLDISATSLVLPNRATGNDISGAMYFDTANNSFQGYNGSDWVTIQSGLQNSSGTTKVEIGASSNDIVFTNDSSESMRVIANGNVGIGSTQPVSKLDVVGNILCKPIAYAINQNGSYLIAGTTSWTGATTNWHTYGFQHKFKTDSGGVPRISIDTRLGEMWTMIESGNVGIGTTNPQSQLHIYETTGTSATSTAGSLILQHGDNRGSSSILFKSATGVSDSNEYAWIEYDDGDDSNEDRGLLTIGINNNTGPGDWRDTIRFNVAGTEVIRFATDNAGNRLVGIGSVFPSSTLDVNGTLNVTGATTFGSTLNVHNGGFSVTGWSNNNNQSSNMTPGVHIGTYGDSST